MAPSTKEITYGHYLIKCGKLESRFIARAFRKGEKGYVQCEGASDNDALVKLKRMLDDRDHERRQKRRPLSAHSTEIPTPEEFRVALGALRPAAPLQAMLKAHRAAGSVGLTAGELARSAGYSDYESANLHYGKFARSIADHLNIKVPRSSVTPDKEIPTLLIAIDGERRPDGNFVWVMHPELAEALEFEGL